jgi:hypothetical protein
LRGFQISRADDPATDDAESNLLHEQLRCTVNP